MGLIEEMVKKAEEDRAAAEGREPDFENPAGIAGVVLNPGESVVGEYGPVAEEVVEGDDDAPVDYNLNTVEELKTILAERGLAVSGNKDELVARLEEDDKE